MYVKSNIPIGRRNYSHDEDNCGTSNDTGGTIARYSAIARPNALQITVIAGGLQRRPRSRAVAYRLRFVRFCHGFVSTLYAFRPETAERANSDINIID